MVMWRVRSVGGRCGSEHVEWQVAGALNSVCLRLGWRSNGLRRPREAARNIENDVIGHISTVHRRRNAKVVTAAIVRVTVVASRSDVRSWLLKVARGGRATMQLSRPATSILCAPYHK
jgi:hypothetical protein